MRKRIRAGALAAVAFVAAFPALLAAQKRPRKPREGADVARLRARVEAALAEARADKGHWAVLIVDAATGQTLFDLNGQRYFVPASNTKLFTTAQALALLGNDYRFSTTIETRGTLDAYGRLLGHLVLVARGDPNLSNRKFPYDKKVEREGPAEKVLAELADLVVSRGIRQIEGDVIVDDSYLPFDRYPPGWEVEDMNADYGAPISALALNDNTLEIEVRPGHEVGQPAWFDVRPWVDFYEFRNEITTGTADSEFRLRAEREPGSRRVTLRGSIPVRREPQTLTLAIEEPAELAAVLLKRLLEDRGVRIYGRALARHAPDDGATPAADPTGGIPRPVVLAEHTSPPLSEAARVVNKISQNLHAELLLRTVAREKGGDGSTRTALRLAQEFFKSIGIEEGDVTTRDASGLSRHNLVTPRAVVRLLQYAAAQPWGEAFRATLPVAGVDGTLEKRMKDTSAAGRIQAKTGSLDHVNALSGYATTEHGTSLIFSFFGNNHNLRGRDATAVLDAISVAMVEELGAPAKKKK